MLEHATMGDIVNRTARVAAAWEQYVVWMRANVAYIEAELPCLADIGHDVSDVEALVAAFGSVFEGFCRDEYAAFVAARESEVSDSAKQMLIAALDSMRECFRPWLDEYHGVVEKTRAAGEPSLPLVLLQGCGAELMKAQAGLAEVIDAYLREIEG